MDLRQPQVTQEKLGRGFRKNEGEWTGKVEINSRKISLAVSEACMAIIPELKGKTFEFWVLQQMGL